MISEKKNDNRCSAPQPKQLHEIQPLTKHLKKNKRPGH
jgi:hypothetical protein